jgi:hypothetical protein
MMIWALRKVSKHYAEYEVATALPPTAPAEMPLKTLVVVPVAQLNWPAVRALRYAKTLAKDVTAVHISIDPQHTAKIEAAWPSWGLGVPLDIIESPYRSFTRPLLQYLGEVKKAEGANIVTVVVPEYVPDAWWEHALHGQSGQFLKLSLLFRPGFVVTSVPSHEVPTT